MCTWDATANTQWRKQTTLHQHTKERTIKECGILWLSFSLFLPKGLIKFPFFTATISWLKDICFKIYFQKTVFLQSFPNFEKLKLYTRVQHRSRNIKTNRCHTSSLQANFDSIPVPFFLLLIKVELTLVYHICIWQIHLLFSQTLKFPSREIGVSRISREKLSQFRRKRKTRWRERDIPRI